MAGRFMLRTANVERLDSTIGMAMRAFFLSLAVLLGACSPPSSGDSAGQPNQEPAPIDQNVYEPYQREGFPKAFAKWGEAGIARIQRLREAAAATVAKNPKCDAVELSELSDARSSPPDNPIVFVDCRNSERFYIGESDVGGMVNTEMEKGARFSSSELVKRCTDEVVSRLSLPSSFDRNLFSVSDRQGTSGNRVVEFTFEAKNRLGLKLPAAARCIMTTQGDFEVNISER
jgi:hypothetical protein